ncbi:hypothetical protein BDQ17DRAFT_1347513 [Cyathus striatus]|nr:hypothetical protein BDQ17DRAFT_1347513 [Cyathus striatus]
MTHTPPQRWDQNHVKDASSYNVPGVDGSTKIYMKPKQVNPTNLEKWEYNNKDDHQTGAKKNDKTMVSKPKAAPKASGGLPVKGGIAKPAQKVGGARVPKKQSATSSKAPAKSTSGKNGQAKVSRKNVSGASVKGSKSSVKQSTRKTSSANNFAAKNTGKSSTKAPATQKSSITGKGGRTTAKSSGGKAKLAVKRPSTKAAVSQKQKTPAKSSSTRSKSTSKALGKANTNNKIPVSKQVSKKALVAKQATKAPTKARVTKQATKAPAKAANKVPAKAPSTKQAIKAPAQAAAKPAIKKGGK